MQDFARQEDQGGEAQDRGGLAATATRRNGNRQYGEEENQRRTIRLG